MCRKIGKGALEIQFLCLKCILVSMWLAASPLRSIVQSHHERYKSKIDLTGDKGVRDRAIGEEKRNTMLRTFMNTLIMNWLLPSLIRPGNGSE